MKSKLSYFLLSFLVLVADQWSKAWATRELQPVGTIDVLPGYFRWSYALNRGVAFSLFADAEFNIKWVLAAISTVAAVAVTVYLLRTPSSQKQMNLALSLLLAGIVGNLIDRVRLGEVVDFIELHWRDQYVWPTFNVADAAICVGAVLLALELMREERAARLQQQLQQQAPSPAPEEGASD